MGGMKISELDFVRLLPAFMRDDEAVIALSKAMNKLMGEPGKRLDTLRTWDKIDELTEAECDELAWEFDVDWYDSTGMSLEEKRETIKFAQQIKRKRGTKWVVERLITAYFGEGYVVEWYETGDAPFTFVVLTTSTSVMAGNYAKFMEAANAAKNERSHLAGVFYYWQQGPDHGIEYAPEDSFHRYDFVKCGTRYRTATIGMIVKSGIETEPEATPYRYGFTNCGGEGYAVPVVGTAIVGRAILAGCNAKNCGTYPRAATLGASLKVDAAAEPAITHALYTFVKCGEKKCGE